MPANEISSLNRARVMLWLTFSAFLITILVGLEWDRRWHATHTFETFLSPPHLFIYGMSALGFAPLAMVFVPDVRRWFGPALVVPCAWRLLILWGAGRMAFLSFGLDETGWSFPHAMLGWSFFVTLPEGLGRCVRSGRWRGTRACCPDVLALSWDTGQHADTRHCYDLLNQSAFQHTIRIYLTWDLTRKNLLFLLLSAL